MDDDEDIHFCIRCKRSIEGLDNYVNHRKQACVKIHSSNVNSKQTNSESEERSESGKTCTGDSEVKLTSQKQPSWNEGLDKNFRQSESSDVLGPFMPSSGYLESDRENVSRYGTFESDVKSVNERERGVTTRLVTFSDPSKAFGKEKDDGTSSIAAPSEHFPRFDDPLFHNDAAVSSFFKSFDSFVDGRFQSLADHQMLFPHKEATDSYESTSQDIEQRYPDLYGDFGGHSSQYIEQSVKGPNPRLAVNRTSKDSADHDTVKTEMQDTASIPGLHVDLKQDDFLSSLDLSSVKLLHDKRKYSFEDEEDDDEDDDQHRPPTHHTGGKWRPGMAPPPSTVAGKWRPFSPTSQDRTDYDDEVDSSVTNVEEMTSISRERKPRIATKGKWLPGKRSRVSQGSSVLRCEPCDTDFSCKSSYRRHMNIHARAAKNGKSVNLERPSRAKKLLAKAILRTTINNWKKKKPIGASDPLPAVENHPDDPEENFGADHEKMVTLNEQNPYATLGTGSSAEKSVKMKCPVCRLSFGAAYLSNHFASLAHIHNELEYREGSGEEALKEQSKIVLANVDTLVTTCHFWCTDCKFYCNLMKDFYRHVASHPSSPSPINNFDIKFACSACPDDGKMSHGELLHHMVTPAHFMACKDKILSAKKVAISSHSAISCLLCDKSFKLYRQYEDHRRKHHRQSEFKLSTRTPRLCPICSFQGHSCKQVRNHIRTTHDVMPHYVCYLCGTMHETSQQAKTHRFSRSHRLKAGKEEDGAKLCRFCYASFGSLQKLRRHLELDHLAHLTPCVQCGFVPILQSDLRVHQKTCKGEILEEYRNFEHRCELCPFSSRLAAHVLLHTTVVHGEPAQDGDTHVCHVCQKPLKSSSLNRHMLFHSQEFSHRCVLCSRSFPVKDWLERHTDVAHHDSATASEKLLCQHCGLTFSSRTLLAQHLETSKCNPDSALLLQKRVRTRTSQRFNRSAMSGEDEGHVCELCGEVCQTSWALKHHVREHRSPGLQVRCPACPYSTGNLAHLRRHRRTHTGVKPFRCPHCQYTASNQENLRRHMKTKKHPGRYLYECKFCQQRLEAEHPRAGGSEGAGGAPREPEGGRGRPTDVPAGLMFVTDLAVEFRKHLEDEHLDKFSHMDEITRHVRSYYRPEEDVLACWETEASVPDEDELDIPASLDNRASEERPSNAPFPAANKTHRKRKLSQTSNLRNLKVIKQSKLKKKNQNRNNRESNADVASATSEKIIPPQACEEQFSREKKSGSITKAIPSAQISHYCLRSENRPESDILGKNSQIPDMNAANDSHITHIITEDDGHISQNNASSHSPSVSTFSSSSLNCLAPQAQPILVRVNSTQNISRRPGGIPNSCGSSAGATAQNYGGDMVLSTIPYNSTWLQPTNPVPSGSLLPSPAPPGPLTSNPTPPAPLPSNPLSLDSQSSNSLLSNSLTSHPLSSPSMNTSSFLMARIVQPQVLASPASIGMPLYPSVMSVQLRHSVPPLLMTASSSINAEIPQIVSSNSLRSQPCASATVTFAAAQPPSISYSTTNVLACPMPLMQPVVSPIIQPRLTGGSVNIGSIPNNFLPATLVSPQTALFVRPLAPSGQNELPSTPMVPLNLNAQVPCKTVSSPSASHSSSVNVVFSSDNSDLTSNCNKPPRLSSSCVDVHRHAEPLACPKSEMSFPPSTASYPSSDMCVAPSYDVNNVAPTGGNKYVDSRKVIPSSDLGVGSAPPNSSTVLSSSTFTAVIPGAGSKPAADHGALSIVCKKIRLPKRSK